MNPIILDYDIPAPLNRSSYQFLNFPVGFSGDSILNADFFRKFDYILTIEHVYIVFFIHESQVYAQDGSWFVGVDDATDHAARNAFSIILGSPQKLIPGYVAGVAPFVDLIFEQPVFPSPFDPADDLLLVLDMSRPHATGSFEQIGLEGAFVHLD